MTKEDTTRVERPIIHKKRSPLGFTISFKSNGELNSRSEWLAKLNSKITPQHGHETITKTNNGQIANQTYKHGHGIKLTQFSTIQDQEEIQKILNNLLQTSPVTLTSPIEQNPTFICNNPQTQNIKKQKSKVLPSIKQKTQIPFLLDPSPNWSLTKQRPVLNIERITNSNDLKETKKTSEDFKLNYYSNFRQIFSKNTSQDQSTIHIQSYPSLNSETSVSNTITKKPTSGILFLKTKKTTAYSTVEELKTTTDKVLYNKNPSQTGLPNDFRSKLLNIKVNQTNARSAPPSIEALHLTNTITLPERNKKENTILNLEKDFDYSAINCLLTNTSSDVDNLKNILDFNESFKKDNSINIIKTEQELFDTVMNFEGEDLLTLSPKEPSLFEEVDQNLNSGSNNFNNEFLKLFNNNISSMNYNDLIEHSITSLTPTESTLEKDEESTTYDCINPQKVHAFINDYEYNITSRNLQMIENLSNFDPINNNNNNYNYNSFNNIDNNIENINYNFNNINHNSYNNNNLNNYNCSNNNIFNSGDGCIMANNNLINNFDRCSNTYSKKKTQALKLKIKPNYNLNEDIATPDVIKIVEALQQEKEKVNLYPNMFNEKILGEDSSSCNSGIIYNNQKTATGLGVRIEKFDSKLLCNQISSCDSAISNTISENNLLSSAKYECALSVGGSSMNSYSDDANVSTSYLSSPPPTPASQISHAYSEYNSTQFSDNIKTKSHKKRGRPALSHSSPPSSEQLENADPNKRKYLEQRYKNNEASRISRRNRKRKEEEERLEEIHEIKRNNILKAKHIKLKNRHEFLKDYLRSIIQD